jgi:hypothetical protein
MWSSGSLSDNGDSGDSKMYYYINMIFNITITIGITVTTVTTSVLPPISGSRARIDHIFGAGDEGCLMQAVRSRDECRLPKNPARYAHKLEV